MNFIGGIVKVEYAATSAAIPRPTNNSLSAADLSAVDWAELSPTVFEQSSAKSVCKDSGAGTYFDISCEFTVSGIVHIKQGRFYLLRITDANGAVWLLGYGAGLQFLSVATIPQSVTSGQRTAVSCEGRSVYSFVAIN